MDNSCETREAFRAKVISKIKSNVPALIGIFLGALSGYIYYRVVGCSTGTCPITSNPWISTLWGALTGYLISGIFTTKKQTKQ